MKNFTKCILSLALMLLALPNMVRAACDFEVGGICYNIKSDGVSVSVVASDTKYSGDIVIPSQVMWNNVAYRVMNIGSGAFSGCTGLSSIVIPNSVTYIWEYAFSGCTGLTSIEIPNSVTYLGQSAFSGCAGLTSITIPNSVTLIIEYAFYGCTGLTSIDIPNGVRWIRAQAFGGCISLTSIVIPSSVTSIESNAFYGCTSLKSVAWNAENCSYPGSFNNCPIENITFGESVKTIPESLCSDKSGITSITVPSSVTNIGRSAFKGCTSLTSVKILNGVTNIEAGAFFGCTSLTSIELPSSVTSIGKSAFYGCTDLTSVAWNAENCKSINSNTFQNCPIEKFTFGESVETIPENCCYGMKNLTSIEMPNGVMSIGGSAFSGCTGLTSVAWNAENCSSVGTDAFEGCSIVKFTFGEPVRTIPSNCCTGMNNLTSIEIPNRVTNVGSGAFSDCSGLTSVVWNAENCLSVGTDAFEGCPVVKFTFGELVKTIPSNCCDGMNDLTSIEIPDSVTSIGEYAFSGCTGLTSIEIPSGVTKMDSGVFSGCTSLTSVAWNAENCLYAGFLGSFEDCPVVNFTFGESVKTIPFYCCFGMSKLTSIEIPNSVTSIGEDAFNGCTSLTSIEIPNSVTSIGEDAFNGCTSLTSIEMPSGVTKMGSGVFSGCTSLTSVVWNAGNCTEITYDTFKNCPIENFTFGESVKTIPFYCCYDMSKLTYIEIPNSVTSIGDCAFCFCTGLTSIVIPNSVTSIGRAVFSDCTGLTSIEIPNSVMYIQGWAFYNCTGLNSIKILNGHATIECNLKNCKNLTYIEAPAGLINYDEADMENVTNSVETLIINGGEVNSNGYKFINNQRKTLKCLDLSNASNNSIPDEVFTDLYNAEFIFLPEGTTSIGYKSFSGCVSLRFARIPSSVTDIEYNAFNDCVGLEYIYCSAETPPTVVSAFTNVDKEIPVYVPCGKVDLYKKAKGWKEFENILCIDEAKQSEEVVAEPTAEPEETSVQLTWAVEHTAGKYVVTVMQGDEVVSILTFDPKGALIDYSTGSSRSASGLRSADANANSFVYTVSGLSKDTEYTYSVEVFDYDGAETEKYVGQFKTLGEVAVDENKFGENVSIKDAVSVFNKTVSVNGYEPSDIRVYNTAGLPVGNPVPASGVYVVKIGGEAVKVMVK